MLTQILKNLFLFANLTNEQLLKIAALVQEKNHEKNSVVIREGELGERVFFVVDGTVKITKISADGREYTLKLVSTGDVFAEVILFTNLPYPANATTLSATRLASLAISDLENLIQKDASLAIELIQVLSKRLYDNQNKIKQLAIQTVYERTLTLLLDLARSQGLNLLNHSDFFSVAIPISRTELANTIGTTRETFTRMLTRLKHDGFILIKDGTIELNIKQIKKSNFYNNYL